MFILLLLLMITPCYAIDCGIPPQPTTPPNCNTGPNCNTNQSQSSQNAVIGGSPSAGINFSGGNNNGGDWAPIPGQLAWPQLAFNGSLPSKDAMYMPPQQLLKYKNTFTSLDAERMLRGMKVRQ
jgi:hypothetical protein